YALAPDLRGHGRSTHTPPGVLYHPLDFLGDIDEIVRTQASAKPVNLVGHSMGAAIAALFASARPHCVRSLVLVEAPVEAVAKPNDPSELLSVQLDYLASPPQNPVFSSVEEAANRLRHGAPSLLPQLACALAERSTERAGSGVRWRSDARLAARAGIGF